MLLAGNAYSATPSKCFGLEDYTYQKYGEERKALRILQFKPEVDGCRINNLHIPDEVDGIKVESINMLAFQNENQKFETVRLGKNIKEIDWKAFANTGIRKLTLNEGLEEINHEAFK